MQILEQLPKEFLTLSNPPKKIYYKGDINLLEKKKVAIIGSRKMSVYTKNCVLELANFLAKNEICVVSGGAIGVDINAHIGAMPLTIGIFANGLNEIYPKSNEKIIKELYTNALALSENEPSYSPKPYDFLLRNRLIIALCDYIVIAQAQLQSGSMQSATLAKKLGKKIFVFAQRLEESKGTNLLLAKNEANLLYSLDDFAKELGINIQKERQDDELLEFCLKEASLQKALEKFGEKIFEYELLGKLEINGANIRVL